MGTRRTFYSDFRLFFLRGLAIALPTVITVGLLFWAYTFLNNNIASPINGAVRWSVLRVMPQVVPEASHPEWYTVTKEQMEEFATQRRREGLRQWTDASAIAKDPAALARIRANNLEDLWSRHWYLHGIGFVVALTLVYLTGVLLGNYLGRRTYQAFERLMVRLPVIKQVYPNVKQITDFMLGSDDTSLPKGRVCLVEYPRRGIWTVGLMTGETMKTIEKIAGTQCVTVFIPSSPTPFTGYTITVPVKEVYELPISFDEAIRFVVSGGVLVPGRQSHGPDLDEPHEYALQSASDLAGSDDDEKMDRASGPKGAG